MQYWGSALRGKPLGSNICIKLMQRMLMFWLQTCIFDHCAIQSGQYVWFVFTGIATLVSALG